MSFESVITADLGLPPSWWPASLGPSLVVSEPESALPQAGTLWRYQLCVTLDGLYTVVRVLNLPPEQAPGP